MLILLFGRISSPYTPAPHAVGLQLQVRGWKLKCCMGAGVAPKVALLRLAALKFQPCWFSLPSLRNKAL